MNYNTFIEKADTTNISDSTLLEMSKVQKDMWAYWLWEYVKCNCCNKIHSKNDIFWHLASDIRLESVTKLEEIFLWDSIKCKNCESSDTDFIHDVDKSVSLFRKKYNKQAFLVLWYNSIWDIVWFMDWYFAYLVDIYNLEISYHYPNLAIDILEKAVINKLDISILGKILSLSSIWTYEKNISYCFIYELIRIFFKIVSENHGTPWIIELDKKNSLYLIYKIMWSISLWIDNKQAIWINENYESDLCVFYDPIDNFNSNFDMTFRQFVKKYKIK